VLGAAGLSLQAERAPHSTHAKDFKSHVLGPSSIILPTDVDISYALCAFTMAGDGAVVLRAATTRVR
jgi:hypothetical protein